MSIRPDGYPSFNRPELVRYDSLRDSKDLGKIADIQAELTGVIGAEAGAQSLFFSFELTVPGTIQVRVLTDSRWTNRFVSVGLRSQIGSIILDERGNARSVDTLNTPLDESTAKLPPGRYTVVVSCSQWQSTPFGLSLRVNPTARLYGALSGRGSLAGGRMRIGTTRLSTAGQGLIGRGGLRSPGAGLFSGRRDRPLGPLRLTGRGRLTGTPAIREPLRGLAAAFLAGSGKIGNTLTSVGAVPRMWVSRLTNLTEISGGSNALAAESSVTLTAFDFSFHSFYFLPAGSAPSERRLVFVYRDPKGQVLWSRISTTPVPIDDQGGWRLFTLPTGNILAFRTAAGAFNTNSLTQGLAVMNIGLDGTVYWHKVYQISTEPGYNTVIGSQFDVTWHPLTNRVIVVFPPGIFGAAPGMCFLQIQLPNGDLHSAKLLSGGTLGEPMPFVNSPNPMRVLIKPNGRVILCGARTGSPIYTWIAEADANLNSISVFYKYTDGATTLFNEAAILHANEDVALMHTDSSMLLLDSNYNIIRRSAGIGLAQQSLQNYSADALGAVHRYTGAGWWSISKEGDHAYRYASFTGLPGRYDQASARRPTTSFKLDTRWAILGTSTSLAPPGTGVVVVGHELDMAATTVTSTNLSITGAVSEPTPQGSQVTPIVIQRLTESGITLTNIPIQRVVNNAWNPPFISADALLTWQLTSSPILRGTASGFPQPQSMPNPAAEPDPLKPFVTLHLPGSGYPGTNVFRDYSGYGLTGLPGGSVRHSTDTSRFPDLGGFYESTSIRFDGNGDFIRYLPAENFRFGTNDFTIEAWIYPTATNGVLFDNSELGGAANYNNSFYAYLDNDRCLVLYALGTERLYPSGAGRRPIALNTWTHVALVRHKEIWRFYINGAVDRQGWRRNLNLSAGALLIGRRCFDTLQMFTGYMADIRITNGVARYTASFTPRSAPIQYTPAPPPTGLPAGVEPAELTGPNPDINFNATLLLVRMNGSGNTFLDDSPYEHTLIPYGNAAQLPGGKWGGNAGNFDAFGDYIDTVSSPNLSLGAGDFTVELWARRDGEGQGGEFFQTLLDSRAVEPSSQIWLRLNRLRTGRQLALVVDGATRILGEPMAIGRRYHVALVRRDGVIRLFMNGVPVGGEWADITNYSATAWTIGRSRLPSDTNFCHFQGQMNDVRLVQRALYSGFFEAPTRPIGDPPTATARYWRLFDLRPGPPGLSEFASSELGLYFNNQRLPGTVASSVPAPISGTLTSTQDLSTTINCSWDRLNLEQVGSYIQLDAGSPVTANAIRYAVVIPTFYSIGGFSLSYSNNGTDWTTLGHINGFPLSSATLSRRLGFEPLPASATDPDFSRVSLLILANEPGSNVLDSGPRSLGVTNFNASKSSLQSIEGGQSLLFNAGTDSYITLGEANGRSVFFSFGTGPFTIEMAVYLRSIPVTYFALYDTNRPGDFDNRANGFLLAVTSDLRLRLFINGVWRDASSATLPINQWHSIRLVRDLLGTWRLTVNGNLDPVNFIDNRALTNRTFTIGRNATGADPMWLNAFVDVIRVTRGLARGSSLFSKNLGWTATSRGRLPAGPLTRIKTATFRSSRLLGRGRLTGSLTTVSQALLQGRLAGRGRLSGTLLSIMMRLLTSSQQGRGRLNASTLAAIKILVFTSRQTGQGRLSRSRVVVPPRKVLSVALTGQGRLSRTRVVVAGVVTLSTALAGRGRLSGSTLIKVRVRVLTSRLSGQGRLSRSLLIRAKLRLLNVPLAGRGRLSGSTLARTPGTPASTPSRTRMWWEGHYWSWDEDDRPPARRQVSTGSTAATRRDWWDDYRWNWDDNLPTRRRVPRRTWWDHTGWAWDDDLPRRSVTPGTSSAAAVQRGWWEYKRWIWKDDLPTRTP